MKLTWKKFSATALAAVMALSLAGCGGSKSDVICTQFSGHRLKIE